MVLALNGLIGWPEHCSDLGAVLFRGLSGSCWHTWSNSKDGVAKEKEMLTSQCPPTRTNQSINRIKGGKEMLKIKLVGLVAALLIAVLTSCQPAQQNVVSPPDFTLTLGSSTITIIQTAKIPL